MYSTLLQSTEQVYFMQTVLASMIAMSEQKLAAYP